jgi:hypothetical protein
MNNDDNNTYGYPDNVAINSLDIADGLKELLIKYGFTLEVLGLISYDLRNSIHSEDININGRVIVNTG